MKKLKKEFSIEGFSDIHIHTAPDFKPRLQTDIEAALAASQEKMDSIVIKSHKEPTSGRAQIASAASGFSVLGGVVLNQSVGGLNPHAVKASAELGGKFVWFPTLSYSNIKMDWDKVEEILHVAAENEMVIATGHLKPVDIFKLIDMARSHGIWRIIINHPLTRVVGASIDEQVEMASYAYLEHCYVACMERHDQLDPVKISDSIKEIGCNRCLMATDFGQTHNPQPVDGMKLFVRAMLDNGISMGWIHKMCIENPQKLIFK
jgi:hypothetical protein